MYSGIDGFAVNWNAKKFSFCDILAWWLSCWHFRGWLLGFWKCFVGSIAKERRCE